MRQIYVPNNDTYKLYQQFYNVGQTGSGYSTHGYIYANPQVGGGLGGFFRSALNYAMPIGKKLLYKGWDLAKPELTKVAKSGVDAIGRYAEEKVKGISNKAQTKLNSLGKRRKTDIFES